MVSIIFVVILSSFRSCTSAFVVTPKAGISLDQGNNRVPPLSVSSELEPATTTSILQPSSSDVIGTIAFLLPSNGANSMPSKFGDYSPVDPPTLLEAAQHLLNKSFWFADGKVKTSIEFVSKINSEGYEEKIRSLENIDVLLAMGLSSDEDMKFAEKLFQKRLDRDPERRFRQCQFTIDCAKDLPTSVGPYQEGTPSIQSIAPWTDDASAKRFAKQMRGLFDRRTSDDFSVALMLFLNRFSGSSVDWVKDSADATWEKGPVRNAKEFYEMATKCGDCVSKCVQDEQCKKCIDTLTEIDTRDQTASYRAIVSFESDLLRDFSFCILQKNNIFNCDATIPKTPGLTISPMKSWRGEPLTREVAQKILIGHLNEEDSPEGSLGLDTSWQVIYGANEAYDCFPSQNQLFYKALKGKGMWYDPVFRVETIDGRNVWCKRHYKVVDGPEVGTFKFSVLDNGVTSDEFWTLVGAADDLSWVIFHYAGAARVVGQQYIGGLVCAPDGEALPEADLPEIWELLKSVGIQPWELFVVDNDKNSPSYLDAGPPPLDFYRKDILAAKQAKSTSTT